MHGRKIFIDDADQIVVDSARDIVPGEGGFPGGTELANPGRDYVRLGIVVVGRRDGVDQVL